MDFSGILQVFLMNWDNWPCWLMTEPSSKSLDVFFLLELRLLQPSEKCKQKDLLETREDKEIWSDTWYCGLHGHEGSSGRNQFWSTRLKGSGCGKAWESPLVLPSPLDSSPKPSCSQSRPAWVPEMRESGVAKAWNLPYGPETLPDLGEDEEPKMYVYSVPTMDPRNHYHLGGGQS